MTGWIEGVLDFPSVDEALSKQFDLLSTGCGGATDISITYYTLEKTSTLSSLEELKNTFRTFTLEKIKSEKDTPFEVELQPIESLIPTGNEFCLSRLPASVLEEVEVCFDDLRKAHFLLQEHLNAGFELDEEVKIFSQTLSEVMKTFKDSISKLSVSADEGQFDDCLRAYEDALGGYDEEGKFVYSLRKVLLKNQRQATNVELPPGQELTVAITGRSGVGKSATANSIIGTQAFALSTSGSLASNQFQYGQRSDERVIRVLEVPCTSATNYASEIPKILEFAPNGFDAVIVVVKYGSELITGDAIALQQLKDSIGEGVVSHIILVVTFGDQAKHEVEEDNLSDSIGGCVDLWLEKSPDWAQVFIEQIKKRYVVFNNRLKPDKHPEAYKTQLSALITRIDLVAKEVPPCLSSLESRKPLRRRVKAAEDIAKGKRNLEREEEEDEGNKSIAVQGTFHIPVSFGNLGCFPATALLRDRHQQLKRMDNLEIGDEVHVIYENELHLEPVFTFIHRQKEVMQEFLKITTSKNKILKITGDHLLFVEKTGQALTIPAREVRIGDKVYVKEEHGVQTDPVQRISTVYETGVYAPVTLSGTILVNDVHTSCYFDVLSHEWSHRAMGIARAVHHLSPSMLQWISAVGEKDGFPGWCRLAHTILTLQN